MRLGAPFSMSLDRYNRTNFRTPARIPSKPAPSLINMNSAGMCENNWGQGELPKPAAKARPRIWYYLDAKLNVPDQHLPFPSKLFGRN